MTPEQSERIVRALERLVEGDSGGASGLEGLGVALAGSELKAPIGPALLALADAVREGADAPSASAYGPDAIAEAVFGSLAAAIDPTSADAERCIAFARTTLSHMERHHRVLRLAIDAVERDVCAGGRSP